MFESIRRGQNNWITMQTENNVVNFGIVRFGNIIGDGNYVATESQKFATIGINATAFKLGAYVRGFTLDITGTIMLRVNEADSLLIITANADGLFTVEVIVPYTADDELTIETDTTASGAGSLVPMTTTVCWRRGNG